MVSLDQMAFYVFSLSFDPILTVVLSVNTVGFHSK